MNNNQSSPNAISHKALNSFLDKAIKEDPSIDSSENHAINEDNKEQIKDLAIQSLIKRSIKKIEIEKQEINRYNSVDLEEGGNESRNTR